MSAMDIGSALFDELKTIMNTIQVKYDYKATAGETDISRQKADHYHMALNEMDTFEMFKEFHPDAVRRAGIATTDVTIKLYAEKPELIPMNLREKMMTGYRLWYISNYVDENPYYRTMSGHPNVDDFDFVYVDADVAEQYGINPLTPIHLLPTTDLLALTTTGFIDTVVKRYPKKKYLQYLGNNAIDPDKARQARNFAIIRVDNSIDASLYEQFINIYNDCRDYTTTVLFNREFSKRYPLYDEFIAMNILIMSIQKMFVSTFQNVVSRDFFDLLTIKNLFDCYQIPFVENLPIDRQRLLVRNINKLLRYKSTNRVLQDVCSLLGYEQLNLVQHYLVKKHILDVNGNPVFYTKQVEDPKTHEMIEVPDYRRMYEIYFQTVDINEKNLALAFTNATAQRQYIDVVTSDPYWWDEDDELLNKLYEEDFNFIETKYLSINVMHRLSKMIFEVIHFMRMIIDKKSQTQYITMSLPKLFGGEEMSIFKVITFVAAAMSKKNHMAGDIVNNVTKTMSVLGFNFKQDFEKIRKMINDNPHYDKNLLKYISNLNVSKPLDLNRLYSNVREMSAAIRQTLADTQDLDQYRAYQKLYKALLICENTNSMYKMSNGELAGTYLEWLQSEAPFMAKYIEDATEEQLNEAIEHSIYRVMVMVTELRYLNIISEENDAMIGALMTLLRFFKSYTTDFTSFDILYVLDDRGNQMIKTLGDIHAIQKDLELRQHEFMRDSIHMIKGTIRRRDKMNLHDIGKVYTVRRLNDHWGPFRDKYHVGETSMIIKDTLDMMYNDMITLSNQFNIKDRLRLRDEIIIIES